MSQIDKSSLINKTMKQLPVKKLVPKMPSFGRADMPALNVNEIE